MNSNLFVIAASLPFIAYSSAEIRPDPVDASKQFESALDPTAVAVPAEYEDLDDYFLSLFHELTPLGEHVTFPFVPKNTRCCKTGELAAKKGLSCSGRHYKRTVISDPYQNHKLNLGQKHGLTTSVIRKIAYKASVCLESDFAGNFKKCCDWRSDYEEGKHRCKVLKRGLDRKKCRKLLRKQFAAYL